MTIRSPSSTAGIGVSFPIRSRTQPANGAVYPAGSFGDSMKLSAQLLKLDMGLRAATIDLGGWDTHVSQIPNPTAQNQGYYNLINNLSRSIRAFADCMKAIGMWDNVMMFTASDFNRTFTPNKTDSTGGSDHGWGGHAFVVGGAVKGKKLYGTFPDLTVEGGIDCQGSRGRWIPSTSVDQYAAKIAQWIGVPAGQIDAIFPNLSRFGSGTNLDFIDYTI